MCRHESTAAGTVRSQAACASNVAAAWQTGFSLLFATVLVALLLVPFIRETHCRQVG